MSLRRYPKLKLLCLCATSFTCALNYSHARFGAPTDPKFNQTLSLSGSYGFVFKRDASYWGTSLNYSHAIREGYGISTSLAFDQETESFAGGGHRRIDTFTAILTGYVQAHEKISFSGGFGKGIMDDDNPSRSYKFTNGDWSTGIAASITLYQKGNFGVNLDTSLEYNLSQSEASMSWDLGVGYSF